jgi:hypothetical protein
MDNEDKYLIICANCAHPSGDLKWFLLADDDYNTVEFDKYEDAREWIQNAGNDGPLAFSILATSDFLYH